MKLSKKLLFILSGVVLVGCGGGTSSSSTSSEATSGTTSETTSETTSGTPELTNMTKFKNTFNSLGLNYVSNDFYFYSFGSDVYNSVSTLTVQPHGMLNSATRTGIALHNNKGYRYGLDMYAAEGEPAFAPSYVPTKGLYAGFFADPFVSDYTEEVYNFLFKFSSSDEVTAISKQLYGSSSPSFEKMFTEGVSDEGYPTFTTPNIAVAMLLLDSTAFARMDGYGLESYMYSLEDILISSSGNIKANNFETVFTLVEEADYTYLLADVYAKDYGTNSDGSIYQAGYPFMERVLLPLDTMSEEEKAYSDLSSVIPEGFLEKGPGEEPAEVAAKRAEMVTKFEPIIQNNNYTLTHTGGILETNTYVANVYDDHAFNYSGSGFTYGYYYLEPNADFSNADKAGIRVYSNSNGAEEDGLISKMSLAYYKTVLEKQGYTVDDQYIATSTEGSFSVNERLLEIFQSNFLQSAYMLDYDELWTTYYGCGWEDLAYYSANTDSFIVGDYYLVGAMFGCDTITSNYIEQVSFDLYLGDETIDMYAMGALYGLATDGSVGYFDFGSINYSNIGTTKLNNSFATYINTAHGLSYPVDAEVAA